tara:strand:- start:102 stop:416 length:315 start_codon:yes stop_codon:yes gene_type:complete
MQHMVGFGGSVSGMITSLKNNARKRKTLYDNKAFFDKISTKKTYVTDKKATSQQLREIRLRLKNESKIKLRRNLIITFGLLILIGLIVSFILKSIDSSIFIFGG